MSVEGASRSAFADSGVCSFVVPFTAVGRLGVSAQMKHIIFDSSGSAISVFTHIVSFCLCPDDIQRRFFKQRSFGIL